MVDKMKENETENYIEELKMEKERLNELLTKGTDALSDYDKKIANDSPEEALEQAIQLVRNHINYCEIKLGGQKTLM